MSTHDIMSHLAQAAAAGRVVALQDVIAKECAGLASGQVLCASCVCWHDITSQPTRTDALRVRSVGFVFADPSCYRCREPLAQQCCMHWCTPAGCAADYESGATTTGSSI